MNKMFKKQMAASKCSEKRKKINGTERKLSGSPVTPPDRLWWKHLHSVEAHTAAGQQLV
jgi:hypothetical protein